MKRAGIALLALIVTGCCGSTQHQVTATNPSPPSVNDQAVEEVTELMERFCEQGIHRSSEHIATDGPVLVVGTAGEIMEGRALLEESNSAYEQRGISVRYECADAFRAVYASAMGDIVWGEETVRTHASFPGLSVVFPTQRTLVFERESQGWRLRYYSLSVNLPDDHLDEVYGINAAPQQPAQAEQAPAGPADGPNQDQ